LARVLLALTLAATPSLVDAWPYGNQSVRGVNAGGWLVLEKWMTPNVFQGLPGNVEDEHALCTYLGQAAAQQRLRAHWDTWVTEADFAFWAQSGLNHVRLPIGYWALDIGVGEPWVSGSWDYVVKAAEWCKRYGLQLMIDLHGVPGSQNGWDHSGQSGAVRFYYDDNNLRRAANVIRRIAEWANSTELRDTVSVIQIINEPVLWDDYDYRLNKLKEYYRMAYDAVRAVNDIAVVCVHDAFIGWDNWYYLRDDPHYFWVMLDVHLYQVFGDNWPGMSCQQHAAYPCTYRQRLAEANAKLWTIVGEWSAATPGELGCNNQADFVKQQIGMFETASGWVMWAHANGQGWREWSYRDSFAAGWINPNGPNNPQC